jgi:hypothetical protein
MYEEPNMETVDEMRARSEMRFVSSLEKWASQNSNPILSHYAPARVLVLPYYSPG